MWLKLCKQIINNHRNRFIKTSWYFDSPNKQRTKSNSLVSKTPEIAPVTMGDWIGKVSEGKSSTNFNNIFFNPHAHGTHTECLGHITRDFYSINQCLKQFFFTAELISVEPKAIGEDLVITKEHISTALDKTNNNSPEAIIIRTLPNPESKNIWIIPIQIRLIWKKLQQFSLEKRIQHLLIDLPSADKEHDEGKLLAHKAFWKCKRCESSQWGRSL